MCSAASLGHAVQWEAHETIIATLEGPSFASELAAQLAGPGLAELAVCHSHLQRCVALMDRMSRAAASCGDCYPKDLQLGMARLREDTTRTAKSGILNASSSDQLTMCAKQTYVNTLNLQEDHESFLVIFLEHAATVSLASGSGLVELPATAPCGSIDDEYLQQLADGDSRAGASDALAGVQDIAAVKK